MSVTECIGMCVCAIALATTLIMLARYTTDPADRSTPAPKPKARAGQSPDFAIDIETNGRATPIRVGPASDGFVMRIRQRDGARYAEPPFEVIGYADKDGDLTITVGCGVTRFKKTTRRTG